VGLLKKVRGSEGSGGGAVRPLGDDTLFTTDALLQAAALIS
jgi:hypothetical protein